MNTQKVNNPTYNRMFSKNDQETLRFFQLPKNLYENKLYKEVSNGAKIMYAILRDRQDLSIINDWVDENGFIFFYYDGDNLSDYLNVSRTTIQKYKKELVESGLLYQRRQGQGKPNMMYILKAESVDTTLITNNCTSRSTKTAQLEVQNMLTNDTDIKDTEYRETEYLHHSDEMTCMFLNLLNAFSIEKFNKPIRKHDTNKIYDLIIIEDYNEEEFTNMLNQHVTQYSYCNLDYIQEIQYREQ